MKTCNTAELISRITQMEKFDQINQMEKFSKVFKSFIKLKNKFNQNIKHNKNAREDTKRWWSRK